MRETPQAMNRYVTLRLLAPRTLRILGSEGCTARLELFILVVMLR